MKAQAVADPARAFKLAMRQLASGVSVITHADGPRRTGFTATAVASLSAEPPTLMIGVNRAASLYAQLARGDLFGVNVLSAEHTEIADCFAGRTGRDGGERFREGPWRATPEGVWLLEDALAALVCEAEDVIERHTHAILIGRVRRAQPRDDGGALLHWRGAYDRIGWSDQELSGLGLRACGEPQRLGA
jgi:flavin reductase (DIM6/NTAB) family NADH-FMN oxidoreductase RutF